MQLRNTAVLAVGMHERQGWRRGRLRVCCVPNRAGFVPVMEISAAFKGSDLLVFPVVARGFMAGLLPKIEDWGQGESKGE